MRYVLQAALAVFLTAWTGGAMSDTVKVGLLSDRGYKPLDGDALEPYLRELDNGVADALAPVLADGQYNMKVRFMELDRLLVRDRVHATITPKSMVWRVAAHPQTVAAGYDNPFDNIDTVYKQTHAREDGRVAWVGLGWIPRNWPRIDATEKDGGKHVTIRIRDGHRGWPIYGIAAGDESRRDDSVHDDLANALMDFAASAKANELMGDRFWVIPDNTSLQRTVIIQVVDEEGAVLAETPCDSTPCMPAPLPSEEKKTYRRNGRSFSVCGTASACPTFVPRPGVTETLE